MVLLQTPQKLDWLLRTEKMGINQTFFRIGGWLQAQNLLTESEGLTQYANRLLVGLLSAFELLVGNLMLTHPQQSTKAEAYRVKNIDE